ncbi:hypothetical protein ESA94_19410 [Lacibacter luteus]|uniref:Leucine-rich repeat domain-containing protein n=1 Tax=Lacibacter luteus TaxID=2508719 RepID=A0A4Q1CDI0_9BACT|nr:hypothetical protein [Lacibacter luteus]RXK57695.1 hypothetical protein ESA94_19410 [Lacibacter luteus]
MRKKKKQKLKEQQFWSTFAYFSRPQLPDAVPTELDRVNFRIWDSVTDDEIELMMTHVRSINMLDLDETEITNYSIELLTQLSFIKELRLKGCNQIDDTAIAHINNIKGLELLHLGGTSISINGLLQLNSEHAFKTLLISVDEPEKYNNELSTLAQRFADCQLIVNHKDFTVPKTDDWSFDQ